jgi:zinc transport system substrate-binding protein
VVNYPLAYLAGRVGGASVEVTLPRELAQGDPAYAEPDADTVVALQGADLIVRNGAGYDPWFDRVTLPAATIVDTSAGFADRLISSEGAVTHSHGPAGEHSHDQTAFTTWLDPLLAIEQAEAIAAALSARRSQSAAAFDAGLAALRTDLEELDRRFAEATAPLADTPLLASHPVYQYFARRYELDLEAVQLEPWAMPTEAQWEALATLHAEHPARWMIWEAQPIAEIVERLQSMSIGVVVVDPCATPPDSGDFLSVMRDNAARLATAR